MATRSRRRGARLGAAAATLVIAGIAAACGPSPDPGPPASASLSGTVPPAAAVSATTSCAGPASPPDATTGAVYAETNASRAAVGLPALAWNPQLWCLASDWSKVMGDSNDMHHRDLAAQLGDPGFLTYNTLGENVLVGPGNLGGGDMHTAWMNSAEHRANILSGEYSSFAVATYYVGGQVWATENFGG
jgi:uncharacterized protein YkwD